MMFKKFSIRTMVILISAVLMSVLLLQGGYTFQGSTGIQDSSEKIEKKILPASAYTQRFLAKFNSMNDKKEVVFELGEDGGDVLNDYESLGDEAKLLLDTLALYDNSQNVIELKKRFEEVTEVTLALLEARVDGESPDSDQAAKAAEVTAGIRDLVKKVDGDNQKQSQEKFGFIKGQANDFLYVAAAIFVVLLGVIIGFLMYIRKLVNSIRTLASDANIIREGNLDHEVAHTRQDEMGDLQGNFENMRLTVKDYIENLDRKVQERTKEVIEEQRKVADLLNNMKQAVFKINSDLVVVPPVSAYANEVFGEEIVHKPIFETLYRDLAPRSEDRVSLDSAFLAVFGEGDMQWDLSVDSMTNRVVRRLADGNQVLRVNYAPLWNEFDELSEIMLVVEDVTELERLAQEKKKNEESIAIIQELSLVNLADLKDFFQSSTKLIKEVQELLDGGVFNTDTMGLMFRGLHTLKGNSRVFGLSLIGSAVHHAESHVNAGLEDVRSGNEVPEQLVAQIRDGLLESYRKLNAYAGVANRIFKLGHDYERNIMAEIQAGLGKVDDVLWQVEGDEGTQRESMQRLHVDVQLEKLVKNISLLNDDRIYQMIVDVAETYQLFVDSKLDSQEFRRKVVQFEGAFLDAHGNSIVNPVSENTGDLVEVALHLMKLKDWSSAGGNEALKSGFEAALSLSKVRGFALIADTLEGVTASDDWDKSLPHAVDLSLDYTALVFALDLACMMNGNEAGELLQVVKSKDSQAISQYVSKTLLKDAFPLALIRSLVKEGQDPVVFFETLAAAAGLENFECLFKVDEFTPMEALMTKVQRLAVTQDTSAEEYLFSASESSIEVMIEQMMQKRRVKVDFLFRQELVSLVRNSLMLRDRRIQGQSNQVSVNASRLKQLEARIQSMAPSTEDLYFLFQQLQYADVKTSMNKYKFMVAELARKLGKKIRFEVEGDDAAIPNERLSLLQDALVHMIRNAVDHGLEVPNVREESGKSPEGTVRIVLNEQGRSLELVLEDDGGGIDADRVWQKAVQRGVIPDAPMSREDKLMLIFLPNLSTKDEISDLSGRGVGMDVVKRNIEEQLGGTLRIESELGKGSKFHLIFPVQA